MSRERRVFNIRIQECVWCIAVTPDDPLLSMSRAPSQRMVCGAEVDTRCKCLPPNHDVRVCIKGITGLSRVGCAERDQILYPVGKKLSSTRISSIVLPSQPPGTTTSRPVICTTV
ncbi:hypothetical protein BS17DRAFT_563468 [Gyrodon lividus]|nr:hypothetical protein BS17DRAFT_563468 [Gyrodon lividus]